jgi:UDP-N-acetylmuramyl tripeptide synthase
VKETGGNLSCPIAAKDSRRLTGVNLLFDRPGAALEVSLPDDRAEAALAAWQSQARRMLAAVGWEREETRARRFAGGATLAMTAPIDGLYCATLVNEWAVSAAASILAGGDPPPLDPAAGEIRTEIARDANASLRALAAAAAARNVTFLSGDGKASIGLGSGSRVWDERELPDPAEVDWSAVADVPVALVTGTNGKSTTVRLVAAIAASAGAVAGQCTSDWVRVGSSEVARGDYSGPEGARLVLRDARVQCAVLEVARGGILRRGLPLPRAAAAAITNIAADHLGEYGILDLDGLADAKFVVAKAVRASGRLILNADDPVLVGRGRGHGGKITWFSATPAPALLAAARSGACDAAVVREGTLVLLADGRESVLLPQSDFPISLGGAARHNLENGLAAIALAHALGLGLPAIRTGLAGFPRDPMDNPGRGNLCEVGAVKVLIDFAHNPHGVRAVMAMLAGTPARRRLVLLGQAGDRSDADLRALAEAVWAARPDRIIVKELDSFRRGRQPGEVPRILVEHLNALGVGADRIDRAATELEAVRKAFAWAAPGDLLILFTHVARNEVIELVSALHRQSWRPGLPLPQRFPDST